MSRAASTPEPAPVGGRRRGWAVFLLALLFGCQREPEPVREQLLVFGSSAEVEVVNADAAVVRQVLAEAMADLAQLERDWHAWQPSALTRVNAALAAGAAAPAPESIRQLLERVRPWSERSGGLFDPAIGGLIALWGFHTDQFPITRPLPEPAQIEAWLAQRPQLGDVRIEGEQIISRNPAVQLDLAAVAEGAAAERVAALLRRRGIDNALLSLGGDLLALGQRGSRRWRVAIRDPIGGGDRMLASIELGDGESLFTSGNYARFRQAPSGQRWAHILDPRSGRPAEGVAEAVVLAADPVRADALATALMVGGPAQFAALLRAFGVRCALILTDQNELMITRAMASRIELLRRPVMLGEPLGEEGDCLSR